MRKPKLLQKLVTTGASVGATGAFLYSVAGPIIDEKYLKLDDLPADQVQGQHIKDINNYFVSAGTSNPSGSIQQQQPVYNFSGSVPLTINLQEILNARG